jgi:3'(2'), 5'-bisphosphate nucleotidase
MPVTEIQPIIEAVQQAAELCRTVQQRYLAQLSKSGNEPVTIADYGAQALICRAISRHFPEDAVIAEERADEFLRSVSPANRQQIVALVGQVLGEPITHDELVSWLDHGRQQNSECTWVIDPIDGTRGFLASRRYVIGVALMESRKPMGAVMGCPEYDNQLLVAWDGLAYTQSLDGGPLLPLHVSDRLPPARLHAVEGTVMPTADQPTLAQIYRALDIIDPHIHRIDAQLDAYALVACGDADFFLCRPLSRCSSKIWDNAAGVALVEAASGFVTDLEGKPLDFSQGDRLTHNQSLLITNGLLHEPVLQALNRVAI